MTPVKKKIAAAMSLADIDRRFNPNVVIPAKIEEALKNLGEAGMLAVDFSKFAGVNVLQLSLFADQFEDYLVIIRDNGKPKTIWCGTKGFAAKARERLNK